MNLKNNITRTKPVEWRKLKWLQGSLKQATDEDIARLKASLTTHGFIRPFKVWRNWILDGHLLQRTMQEMEAAGMKIPDKLPADFVRCRNIKHAKELVLVFSSIYHKATEESLELYLKQADLKLSAVEKCISIPELTLTELDTSNDKPGKDVQFSTKDHYRVIVECKGKSDQAKLYRRLLKEGYECKLK